MGHPSRFGSGGKRDAEREGFVLYGVADAAGGYQSGADDFVAGGVEAAGFAFAHGCWGLLDRVSFESG